GRGPPGPPAGDSGAHPAGRDVWLRHDAALDHAGARELHDGVRPLPGSAGLDQGTNRRPDAAAAAGAAMTRVLSAQCLVLSAEGRVSSPVRPEPPTNCLGRVEGFRPLFTSHCSLLTI